jgi:hypothetical protein
MLHLPRESGCLALLSKLGKLVKKQNRDTIIIGTLIKSLSFIFLSDMLY